MRVVSDELEDWADGEEHQADSVIQGAVTVDVDVRIDLKLAPVSAVGEQLETALTDPQVHEVNYGKWWYDRRPGDRAILLAYLTEEFLPPEVASLLPDPPVDSQSVPWPPEVRDFVRSKAEGHSVPDGEEG